MEKESQEEIELLFKEYKSTIEGLPGALKEDERKAKNQLRDQGKSLKLLVEIYELEHGGEKDTDKRILNWKKNLE